MALADIDLADLGLDLVFVRNYATWQFQLNPGSIDGEFQLLPPFETGYRLFKGEDLQAIVDLVNNLTIRAALMNRQRMIVGAGDVTVALGDYNILLNKAVPAASNVYLPACADFVNGGYGPGPIWINDYARNSGANAATLLPAPGTADTFNGFANWQLKQNGASVFLRPDTINKNRWIVANG